MNHIFKTVYCTFHIFHILKCTSPHESGEFFVLFLDLLGSDAVLAVEDGDVTKFALHL